ncbi:heme o synthase [Kocuria palustris]|uniref:heme o synthase n=1 Tax=Kocuria palustris TaxID=71999 RepID=UPI0011A08C69|nr:heme o synthase [Kocuria palustris]
MSSAQASRHAAPTGSQPAATPGREPRRTSPGRRVQAYLQLMKLRIVELLLVATVPTMIFAHHHQGGSGFPSIWLILVTLVGGTLSAGAAGAFNSYIDRESDRLMKRTSKRPLVTRVVADWEALALGWVLSVVSVLLFALAVNVLTGVLTAAAIFLYAVFYSIILKRRTSQNIVWGGVAGCMPVLIAWAAVTGTVQAPALVLFAVIFLWTPPHYWPLSMKYADDYARAGIPMLGAIAPEGRVASQVVLYAWATVICSLLLVPVGGAGWVYAVVTLAAGAWFLLQCHRLLGLANAAEPTSTQAMKVFHGSITYLSLVFVAVAVDPFLGGPIL